MNIDFNNQSTEDFCKETTTKLLEKVIQTKPNLHTKCILVYSNKRTKTVVLQIEVFYPLHEFGPLRWIYLLVGNDKGRSYSNIYVQGNIDFSIGKISEDNKHIIIEKTRYNADTIIGTWEFNKNDFILY